MPPPGGHRTPPASTDPRTPVRPDPKPKLYQSLGKLKIEDRAGRTVTINLYWTDLPSSAFTIDGKYYRGGRDEVIEDAIRAAHADAGKHRS